MGSVEYIQCRERSDTHLLSVKDYHCCRHRHTPGQIWGKLLPRKCRLGKPVLCRVTSFKEESFWNLTPRFNPSLSFSALTECRWQPRWINSTNFNDVVYKLHLEPVIQISWWRNCLSSDLALFTHFPVYSISFFQKECCGIACNYFFVNRSHGNSLFLFTFLTHLTGLISAE